MSKKMNVSVEIPEFDGYEFVRFGYPEKAIEVCLTHQGKLSDNNQQQCIKANSGFMPRMIYQPIKVDKWRPATLADVKRVISGEEVIARFTNDSDLCDRRWTRLECRLAGVDFTGDVIHGWYSDLRDLGYLYCEVLESE